MNRVSQDVSQRLSQTQPQKGGNAHAYKEFGSSSTPAPTPPGTDRSTRKAGVGAGILNNQVGAGAGVKKLEVKYKGERQHRGKPPVLSLMGQAGFSTPFPEGFGPFGGQVFIQPY